MSALEPLIDEDGAPFPPERLEAMSAQLLPADETERIEFRNFNANEISGHSAARMLIVSGPGTGKSTLFMHRLQAWLARFPEHRIMVGTFVGKLVRDLNSEVNGHPDLSDEEKEQIDVMTLHRLARRIVELNRGADSLRLNKHVLIVSGGWEEMVWSDALSLTPEFDEELPWELMRDSLYDGEPRAEASWLETRASHLQLLKFYNALTFADLILVATDAAIESPELVDQTLFIFDEFQDFNLAEEVLIQALTRNAPAVLLVGDDDQVLYEELRRGHASIIRRYYQDADYANAMLPLCSRSYFHICRAAQAFLSTDAPAEAITKAFVPLRDAEGAEKVKVVASTTPSSGVDYIERFLDAHKEQIEQREIELQEGTEKDAYLLILARGSEFNFLAPKGAKDRLSGLVAQYQGETAELGYEYWKLRDYYKAGIDPDQNYLFRKVMAHEAVDHEIIAEVLQQALTNNQSLSTVEHAAVRQCLDACTAVVSILERDDSLEARVDDLTSIIEIDDPDALMQVLDRFPFRTGGDVDSPDPLLGQPTTTAPVQTMSITGSKGLSADHVIVLGCDETNLSGVTRNAFFVAMTRARKSLTLMACIGGGGASELHPFLMMLPDGDVEVEYARANNVVEEMESIEALQSRLRRWQRTKTKKKAERRQR